MIVKTGEDRIALIGERLTVKVARSNPVRFSRDLSSLARDHGVGDAVGAWRRSTTHDNQSLRGLLLRGVAANRREGRLARDYEVVVPTISLPGGVINVQPTAQPVELPHREIHSSFVDHLGPRVTKLAHMLERPGNLGVLDGYVKFVDGGSQGLEELMHSQPDDVEQALLDIGGMLGLQPSMV